MATKSVNVESIGSYFELLSNLRHTRNRKHLLIDIIVIAVCGMMCGCDGPTTIHRWASNRIDWLQALNPQAFQRCFLNWTSQAIEAPEAGTRRLIAIDGKTCRGSHDAAHGLGCLHIVSAWASEEGIALGQVATAAKSNEITAIPEVLKVIDLPNSLITVDAIGCQKEIARDIVVRDR